jgi:predicted CopG family antitoxin
MAKMEDMTTITVRKRTQEELKKRGKMGDTFDDVIWRLLQCQKTA